MDSPEPQELLAANWAWAAQMVEDDPEFFARLSEQQTPGYLWIGCADSRVPASQVVGQPPGELFVHRNIANQVQADDVNCQAVLQYAIDVLKVEHVVVAGHYGCGGVAAALGEPPAGPVGEWLEQLGVIKAEHAAELGGDDAVDRFCEINVRRQVLNVAGTGIVQDAWARGQELVVHGWIYQLADGLLQDLSVDISGPDELETLTHQYGP